MGLGDLTRNGPLPEELDGLFGWIACIADAQPVSTYVTILENANIQTTLVETQDSALTDMISAVRGKLVGLELLAKLKQIDLPGADFDQARALAQLASESVHNGTLGYALLVGQKRESS